MAGLVDVVRNLPRPVRRVVYSVSRHFVQKEYAEMAYWKTRWAEENGGFDNSHYRKLMLGIAGEADESFLDGLTVADFGCGPRGSLTWAKSASVRIGIDVLASRYFDSFAASLKEDEMVYVTSTEGHIPIGSSLIDVMFSVNAMDHVHSFDVMAREVRRVLKPGGRLIASFNLNEPAAPCEPQTLTEQMVKTALLAGMDIESYIVSAPGPATDRYGPLFAGEALPYEEGDETVLWVRAMKVKP